MTIVSDTLGTPRSQNDSDETTRASRGFDANAAKDLKARDNVTNWFHLAQIYVVIGASIGLAIWTNSELSALKAHWGWSVAVNVVAILVIGAAQHQFGGAIHEGTHFLLFKNRTLNELASDWLAAFPIYTSTYQFRVHHLAHHQFVNDPERDPDIAQLKESGHWLDFPVPSIELLWKFAKQLSPIQLMRFTVFRAKYSAVGFDNHAYMDAESKGSKLPLRIGILFAVPLAILVAELTRFGHPAAALAILAAAYIVTMGFLAMTKEADFAGSRLLPVISHRATMMSRVTYFALLYGAVTALDLTGLAPGWHYYSLYWVVPLFTSFPLFMMLRQWVQHGNADRGRYTNTRVFLVGPLIRYSVFPWGMDYHLPHHMMASVPHYNLKRLHEILLDDPEYREKGVVLDGFFVGNNGPSVIASLGPEHAPKTKEAVFVDNATLEYAEVRDAASIALEAERSASVS